MVNPHAVGQPGTGDAQLIVRGDEAGPRCAVDEVTDPAPWLCSQLQCDTQRGRTSGRGSWPNRGGRSATQPSPPAQPRQGPGYDLGAGVDDATDEQNSSRLDVPDREDERPVQGN